ncbi:uncharacterized protein STEHIDRAFT_149180 [Stereum hirsutum FP-91666 SS1]|uniref:uncharacterized protein n=1 Tax=Stereum hirsutum (strain FP-91666) TaxID=721885 RepID=UPI0004449DC7|nr:uncharacterized protein STEHIDRAFT_149180 [Stereum hirsutum FP-91666 SS1]EIM82789.1 hypothetical protein STEHIDRAFT_149180 [Stereum hirsutum FP-91666 SS1]
MDPAYRNKKVVDLTDQECIALGFLGESVAPGIKDIVEKVRADPVRLGTVTCFAVDCLKRRYGTAPAPPKDSPTSPASPISEAETLYSQLSTNVVAPDLISKYEMHFWYHGISGDPPKLLWRSDIETNPFPTPPPGARFFKVPTKTARGVFNTPLNAVWDTVAPQILASIKAKGLQYSALKTIRFSIVEDGQEEKFGPVVVWIAVRPNTTNAVAVRNATPDILHILNDAQITGVVVEWYEGSVQRLAGPPLMNVEDRTSPKFGLSHPFNTGLGIPIARQSDDAQGTITFLFREVKTSNGGPSNRILALTNKHVASVETSTHYELTLSTSLFASKLESGGGDSRALRRKKNALDEKDEDNAILQTFFIEVSAQWQDINNRKFGVVDWAPEISVRVDDHHYTRDIATFAVDEVKLENFERNVVDLGNQYNAGQLEDLFWPIAAVREGRKIPADLQLPITRALPRRLFINPDTEDKDGNPLYIVAKYGNSTKLTLGRYSGMDAYTCTDLGLESREVAIYNYGKNSGDFSDHGDSGSLIFTGAGDALAILHSGMPRGMHNHVTYGTPIWWVIKQILAKYPSAEFYGITYTLD